MKEQAVSFNQEELDLLQNRDFLPLKFEINKKLELMLSQLHSAINHEISGNLSRLPSMIVRENGKISRGENYHTYSYRVLDYPRSFTKRGICLFRYLILWGHTISFHFIISDEWKEDYQEEINIALSSAPGELTVCLQEDPWQWFYNQDQYISAQDISTDVLKKAFHQRKFIKISRFIPLAEYKLILQEGLAFWQYWQNHVFLSDI